MSYDNAQLARVYLHSYQITRNHFYKRIAEELLDYVAREMTHAGAGQAHERDRFVSAPTNHLNVG